MRDQHLFKSPAIGAYCHCRLLLPWLRVPCWFFCNPGLKNCRHGQLGFEPTTLDLCSQSGANDLSATATPYQFAKFSKTRSNETIAWHEWKQYLQLGTTCTKVKKIFFQDWLLYNFNQTKSHDLAMSKELTHEATDSSRTYAIILVKQRETA